MKKAKHIIILISIVSFFNNSKAQTISTVSDSSIFAPYIKEVKQTNHSATRLQERHPVLRHRICQLKTHPSSAICSFFKSITNKTFAPEVSVDLLSNKGIHLFTISNIPSIPTINVGARIHAGIIINL